MKYGLLAKRAGSMSTVYYIWKGKPSTLPKQLLLVLTVMTLCLNGIAQSHQFLFSHIGPRDGLASEHVLAVVQDRKGFIWISTQNGFQRYDGQRFINIRTETYNGATIPEGVIFSLSIDEKDRLWMVIAGNRVGYLNTSDFSFRETPIRYPKEKIERAGSGLYVDRKGTPLLVLVGHSHFTFDEKKQEFTASLNKFQLPDGWKPYYIWQDTSLHYWVGTDSGLVKINGANGQLSYRNHNPAKDPVIQQFRDLRNIIFAYYDHARNFWITAWPGGKLTLYQYNLATGKTKQWQDDISRALNKYYEPRGVLSTTDGNVWTWGMNLFARINLSREQAEVISNNLPGEYSIRYDDISQIYEDREQNIWVCTDKGLFRFNPPAQKFKLFNNRRVGKDSVYSTDVTGMLELKNGSILISTWGSGIFQYDSNFNAISDPIAGPSLKGAEIMTWCLLERRNGDIVRGHQAGVVFIYHPATGITETFRDSLFRNSTVRQVVEDREGNLIFGTQRGLLVKMDTNRNFTLYQDLKSTIVRLQYDRQGALWAATTAGGVFRLETSSGKIVNQYTADLGPEKSLRSNSCSDLLEYDDSTMVIAAGGLNFLNKRTGKIRIFSLREGLPSNEVANLVMDQTGQIWMTSGLGIAAFDPKGGPVHSYNASDGVHTNSFSLASSYKFRNGQIAFGTSHDILVFDPYSVSEQTYSPPKVEISGISVMNKWLSLDSLEKAGGLQLRHDQNSIVIEFSTLTYQNSYGIHYQLEGLDDEWTSTGQVPQVVLSYLPPGNYTLNVATRDGKGELGEITKLKLTVNAPFWKSTWFYSLLALILAGGLFWLDRQRQNRVRREWEMRSDIAGNLHEEVNTTLQNINVLSEIAGMKANTDAERSKEYIYDIQQKSRNMVIAMNDVLWSIDPQNDSMPRTIERIHEVAQAMRSRHEAEVSINLDKNVPTLNLNMRIRHEFIIIYKLAMVTLIEKRNAKAVQVNLEYQKGILKMGVTAPGLKINRHSNEVGRNLSEMEKRARSISALLTILEDAGGATIILKLSIGNGIKAI